MESLYRDSASQYPRGPIALRYYVTLALRRGDRDAAFAALKEFVDRDGDLVMSFETDPQFKPLLDDPRFHFLARIHASKILQDARWEDREPTTRRLLDVAQANRMLGDFDAAIAALTEASQRPDAADYEVQHWLWSFQRMKQRYAAGEDLVPELAPCESEDDLGTLLKDGSRAPCFPIP